MVNTSRSRLEEVNVPGLQPGKKYSLRVAAFNEAGAGTSTTSLEVETLVEPHVLQAPANLSVKAVSSVSLMASWESPDLGAAGGGAAVVAGDAEELDADVAGDGADEIGEEDERPLQDGDQGEGLIGVVGPDSGAERLDAGVDLLGGDQGVDGAGQGRLLRDGQMAGRAGSGLRPRRC